jgi:hypothetical protein
VLCCVTMRFAVYSIHCCSLFDSITLVTQTEIFYGRCYGYAGRTSKTPFALLESGSLEALNKIHTSRRAPQEVPVIKYCNTRHPTLDLAGCSLQLAEKPLCASSSTTTLSCGSYHLNLKRLCRNNQLNQPLAVESNRLCSHCFVFVRVSSIVNE